ncbi:hypothetical protein [Haloferax sp. AS1]|nr:hypothetical protein [Haloferax sp. AS1]
MTDEENDKEEVEKPEDAPDGFEMTALSDSADDATESDRDSEEDSDE